MTLDELKEIGVGKEYMGTAEQALLDCPSLPKGYYAAILQEWTAGAYIIYSTAAKWGVCTKCGKHLPEKVFQKGYAPFTHNDKYTCPHCGRTAIAKSAGMGRGKLREYMFVTIPLKKGRRVYILNFLVDVDFGGIVPKVISFLKTFVVLSAIGQRYYSRPEYQDSVFRERRIDNRTLDVPAPGFAGYFTPKRNVYRLYTGNLKSVFRGTCLHYADVSRMFATMESRLGSERAANLYPMFFLRYAYFRVKYAAIERLEQSGLDGLIIDKITNSAGLACINWRADTLRKIFALNLGLVREIRKRGFGLPVIAAYKHYVRKYPWFTLDHAEVAAANRIGFDEELGTVDVARYIENRKLLDYAVKQRKRYKWKTPLRLMDYVDYLRDCRILNYDMTSRDVLFPKAFRTAHARTGELVSELRTTKEAERLALYDPAIEANGIAISRMQAPYWSGDLMIFPAKTTGELIREGRELHHCVGGYYEGMARGRYAIMFIRKADCSDTPYFTLQLMADGRIEQNRGKYNCSPDDEVKAFVDKWHRWFERQKPVEFDRPILEASA
ncbi:MAG: PcfJ domain-containing protein [Clostridiales Family XIII bacterium]|jgi:predicted RNA-binding Zn-ribbon protein involved in translation (DUF1610 family)|nr:PcfJ domain-containing protein [Clostridiales Family XIII bacterium]